MGRVRLVADDQRVGGGQLVDHRGAHLDDLRSRLLQQRDRRRDTLGDRRVGGLPVVVDEHADPDPGDPGRLDPATRALGAVEHVPGDRGAVHVGGQQPDVVQRLGQREHARRADVPVRRLEPDHPAVRGGRADAATGVGAQRQRHVSRRDGRGRARRRATGDPGAVVRVAGGAGRGGVAGRTVRELLGVQLRDDDGAGRAQPRDRGRVGAGRLARRPARSSRSGWAGRRRRSGP